MTRGLKEEMTMADVLAELVDEAADWGIEKETAEYLRVISSSMGPLGRFVVGELAQELDGKPPLS